MLQWEFWWKVAGDIFLLNFKFFASYKAPNDQTPSSPWGLKVWLFSQQSSQTAGLHVVQRVSKRSMGGRTFSYQAPLLWNQLPEWEKLSIFKIRLRVFLKHFSQSLYLGMAQVTLNHPFSYDAVGLDCRGTSNDALSSSSRWITIFFVATSNELLNLEVCIPLPLRDMQEWISLNSIRCCSEFLNKVSWKIWCRLKCTFMYKYRIF